MADVSLSSDGAVLTVCLPLALRRRGGRKLIITADGQNSWPAPTRPRCDSTLLRAVVQAFKWKHLLDSGKHATVSELAAAERLNISYVSHVLRLTLLAPDLVEAVLDGRQPPTMQLQPLMRGVTSNWIDQRQSIASVRL